MSTPGSIFDQLLENDETIRSWKTQLIENENFLKSMQNDLEVEQAKETLLLTEMRGKILQIEQLAVRSSQQANQKLQNLMVDQLVEINKSEILVKVNEENYKQCAIPLQAISQSEPNVSDHVATATHVGQEKESEIQLRCEVSAAETLKDNERKAVEDDISKTEDAIAQSEKEHAVLKDFLTEHQRLLIECCMESAIQPEISESKKRLCTNEDNTTAMHSKVTPTQLQEPSTNQWDQNTRLGANGAAPSDINSAPSCSMPRAKKTNRTFEAKSAIISKKVGNVQNSNYLPKGSDGGYRMDYRTSESVTFTSLAEPKPPMKQARINLYDTPGANQPTAVNSQAPPKKSNTTFKLKIPSALKNRIN